MRLRTYLILGFTLITLASCIFVPVPFAAPGNVAPNPVAGYGERVRYIQGQPIEFPDFTLTFRGVRHESSEQYPRGFDDYDFTVSHANKLKTVRWSSGTGEIAPARFSFGGSDYQLELGVSEQLGALAEQELVIWQLEPSSEPTAAPPSATPEVLADFNTPFTLKLGQLVRLPSDLRLIFTGVASDSRCPTADGGIIVTCVVRGEALITLTVYLGNAAPQEVTLSTDNNAIHTNRVTFAGWTIYLSALAPHPTTTRPEIPLNEYQATLLVATRETPPMDAPEATFTPAPTPTVHYDVVITINCDQMTPAAVEAILGEPVAADSMLLNFFCVYGSIARADQAAPADFPLYLGDFAQRQVVAATQWGVDDEPDPLLELADRIRTANPTADEQIYNQLLAQRAARLYADAFAQLPLLAAGTDALHVTPVAELGEAAVWLWQPLANGRHFAAVLAFIDGKYVILYALTNTQRAEEPARTAAIALVQTIADR